MTNPKHTDTSRSGDLVEEMRDLANAFGDDVKRRYSQDLLRQAAYHIKTVEAENERLRREDWFERFEEQEQLRDNAEQRLSVVEAEVERLRGALGDLIEAVQRRTADLGGYDGRFGLNKSIVKARAALGEK